MRNIKRFSALAMATVMMVSAMAGCGAKPSDNGAAVSDGGKVLNIYAWNEEFKSRPTDHYPGYTKVDETSGTIGDVQVKWTIVPSDDNAYQNNLDETLLKQKELSADEKIDIFLVEADYAVKYVDTEYTVPVKDLGIQDTELANQYQYTKDIVTDSNGVLKGVSWQGCPGVMIYSREVAKEVFGTDEPAEVQKKVSSWDAFNDTAAEMKEAGYFMVSGYDDTYRVFSNNVSGKWVQDGKVVIDESLMKWVEQTKEFTDNGYNNKSSLWGDTWNQGFYPDGKVFCYFGPAWFVDFSMAADQAGSIANAGGWAATEGPQGFFWGGTWICAANGTDNKSLVADIIRQLTVNETIMKEIVVDDNDFVNNVPAMEAMAADPNYKSAVLGGQNPLPMYCAGAEKISMNTLTSYDQGCNEEFQAAMKDYFDGNATLDEALANFKKNIVVKYPGLKAE